MKYIITEHKLDELIFKFIHDYIMDGFERQQFDTFIVYITPEDDGIDEIKIEHDSDDGRLYISKEFVTTISSMFGLTPLEAQLKIYDWFKWYEDAETKYLDTPRVGIQNIEQI